MSRFISFAIFTVICAYVTFSYGSKGNDWTYPWEECRSMDQIVGRKCEPLYYVCDFGDTWFTKTQYCNNCIGDCPKGKVFDNITEVCVQPNTIGCDCTKFGQVLGTQCDSKYYVCKKLSNGEWTTTKNLCETGYVFDLSSISCKPSADVEC